MRLYFSGLQSFGLPSLKTKPYGEESMGMNEGCMGIPEIMTHGAFGARSTVDPVHPLQKHLTNVSIFLPKFYGLLSKLRHLL